MNVVFLESAEADLKDLKRYIVQNFGQAVWQSTYGKIRDAAAMIARHPKLGRVPPELESLNMAQYRQVVSGMNRIIYELREDATYVHIVCDTRRDLQSLLLRRIAGRH